MTAFTLRPAAPADVPDVLRLVRGLAEYERLLHEVTSSEADLARCFVRPQAPRPVLAGGRTTGSAVGLALYYYTLNTFKAARTCSWKTCSSSPPTAARASASR